VPSLRIDGKLRTLDESSIAAVDHLLAECAADLGSGMSLDRALHIEGVGRFRINVYRTQGRLAAAIRVLLRQAPTLEELHFPVSLSDVVQSPHGLVLVTGSTGSGKSATLAALAQEALRQRGGVLISLEDPVEYTISASGGGLVRQREVGRDVRDFHSGLYDALREDPDILLIGEMRDAESISLALTAAETGHLVLASLHSRSAASSVERIVDSYAPERQQQIRVQLADALRAVIAQRLLPRARGSGRLPALEILRGNTTVASLIREGKTAQIPNTISSSKKEGMFTLERCLADLVRSGQITREAALAVANDVSTLNTYLSGG
jgi:twitching motility protein PilT